MWKLDDLMYKSVRKGKICYQNSNRISHQAKMMENYKEIENSDTKETLFWRNFFLRYVNLG